MTNCSLILVALCLIGLGLGDSPLVILSLCSLVLFFVISSLLALLVFLFSPFLLPFYVSFFVLSVLPYVFMRSLFNIYSLTYQKKKKIGVRPILSIVIELGIKDGIGFQVENMLVFVYYVC